MPVMKPKSLESQRVLVYVEQMFWKNEFLISTDEPFVRFLDELLPQIRQLIYLARLDTSTKVERYVLSAGCVVWPVPHYDNLIELTLHSPSILLQIASRLIHRRREWDVACICGPHLIGLTVALVCEFLRRPYFIIVRENLPEMVQWRYAGILRLPALIQATCLEVAFMALSRFHPVFIVGDKAQKKYRRVGAQVRPLFVSLVTRDQFWNPGTPKVISEGKPFQLLAVGRLAPEKGLMYLIDAIAALIRLGKKVHLKIVGEGPERKVLEDRISALCIQPHVSFSGYIPYGTELLQCYRNADALVLTSFSEGFPQVILEAMANSLPVVATRVGGIPQLVKHEQNGLLISPGSTDELVSMLLHLIETPNLRDRLSASAYCSTIGLTRQVQVGILANTLRELIS